MLHKTGFRVLCYSRDGVTVMVFNATFNNISVISWKLVNWLRKLE